MNQHDDDRRLLTQLRQLHQAALAAGDAEVTNSRARLRRRLLEMAARGQPVLGAANIQPLEQSRFPGWARWLVVAGASSLVVVGGFVVRSAQRQATQGPVSREPVGALVPTHQAPAVSARLAQPLRDPCSVLVRAAGRDPLIDDFEDGNPFLAQVEDRVGIWAHFKDSDPAGSFNTIAPNKLELPTRNNRFALHMSGGELLNWGAVVQFSFQPTCYDVSAYAGITFRARGPGRLYVGMREVSVVPTEYGGTCTRDCYNTHQKKVDLTARWQTYSVLWREMRQRGYETKPLDPGRVNGLGFLVQASDTPYDVWIDDVKFVSR